MTEMNVAPVSRLECVQSRTYALGRLLLCRTQSRNRTCSNGELVSLFIRNMPSCYRTCDLTTYWRMPVDVPYPNSIKGQWRYVIIKGVKYLPHARAEKILAQFPELNNYHNLRLLTNPRDKEEAGIISTEDIELEKIRKDITRRKDCHAPLQNSNW